MKTQIHSGMKIKKKNSYIITSIILIVVILVIIAVFFIINKSKDAKDLYFQTEIKNFVNIMDELQKKQNSVIAKNKPFVETPSRARYELSAKLVPTNNSVSDSFINLPNQAIDIINSTKLVYNSRYDVKKDTNISSLSFLLEGQNFIDINTVSQDDNIGLQIPVIHDKYFVLDKKNISVALANLGFDVPIKSIFSFSQIKNSTTFSIEDSKKLSIDYFNFLKENISEKNITFSRNVKLQELELPAIASTNPEEGKKTGEYNVFSINLTEDEFKPVAIKTIEVLFNDSRFTNMTTGNLNIILNLFEESGYFNIVSSIDSTLKTVNKYTDSEYLKSELISIINNTSFPDGFKMTLALEPNGTLADRRISLSSKAKDEPIRKYDIQIGKFFIKTLIEQKSASGESDGDNAIIEFEKINKSNDKGMYLHINCLNNLWPDFDLAIDLSNEETKDDKRKAINNSYFVDVKLTSEELGFNNANVLLDIKREDRYDMEFTIPKLNNETSINLNTANKEQIQDLMMELQFSAAKFLLGNQSILNAFEW